MEAIVLAGGFGTRLSHVVKDVPKPMADVAGKPFLERILSELIKQGVNHIVLAVHYKKECIVDYFGSEFRGAKIDYSVEDEPLLTGGAIKQALKFCKDEYVYIINGDTYFEVPLSLMRERAEKESASVMIAVKEMHNFSRYGKVSVNNNHIITAFHEKAPCDRGFINGGIYYLKKSTLDDYNDKFSLETECFQKLNNIHAFESKGYFIDIGIPEDYRAAQEYFSKKRPAAFFDRDGTINVNFGYVYKPEDLEFIRGIPERIKEYNDKNIPVIVITNQAGIARGLYTEDDMHRFHKHMNNRLRAEYGAHIDAFYFCPHHPDITGECKCRKPNTELFIKAADDLNIDLTKSVMYGDKESDREAAKRAGILEFISIPE